MRTSKQIDPLEQIDSLVREDMRLGRDIARKEKSRDLRLKLMAQKLREEAAPFETELEPLIQKREQIRTAILGLWKQYHDGDITLDLPCAKVSRRNYLELIVHDKDAVLDSLDAADALDVVDYVFDEKAVARLILDGKLPTLEEGAVEVVDNYNLQVRPRKETARASRTTSEA